MDPKKKQQEEQTLFEDIRLKHKADSTQFISPQILKLAYQKSKRFKKIIFLKKKKNWIFFFLLFLGLIIGTLWMQPSFLLKDEKSFKKFFFIF